jgi:outer membrane protein, heavy metal efflux system
MLLRIARRWAVCALLMNLAPAWASDDSSSATEPLTLRQALAWTLERNPNLAIYPSALRALEAERLQAGLRVNPEFGTTLENFAGNGDTSGTKVLETTLSLSQLIELGGKRGSRVDVADAEIGTANADYAVARLDALAETTRRFTDLAQTQAEIELADRAVVLTQAIGASVERRIRAGAASTAERSRTAVALIRAQLDAQSGRAELEGRRIALAAMWGETYADFSSVAANLEELSPLAELAPLTERLRQSPELARFAAERRLREAELKLARAQAKPDVTFEAGVRRLNATDDFGLVASMRLPLAIFNRNQGGVAAADARIAQSDAERDAASLRLRSVLYGLYQEARQARVQASVLRDRAVPEAEQALTLIQRGFENGRFSFLELADAQRQVLDLRAQTIAAFADAHRLDVEIERLTAQPITTPAQASTSGEIR